MDMSFANQALCAEFMAQNASEMEPGVYEVPVEIDEEIAALKALGYANAAIAGHYLKLVLAIVVGFWRFLRNTQSAAWERTARA